MNIHAGVLSVLALLTPLAQAPTEQENHLTYALSPAIPPYVDIEATIHNFVPRAQAGYHADKGDCLMRVNDEHSSWNTEGTALGLPIHTDQKMSIAVPPGSTYDVRMQCAIDFRVAPQERFYFINDQRNITVPDGITAPSPGESGALSFDFFGSIGWS